jgi:hypothetical protein
MNSTKFSSLAVLSSLFLLSLFTVSVTSHQENQLLHAEKNETTQQHPQQHKNDTMQKAGDLNEDGYDFDEDDKKEIKAIRRAVRALAHKMMMQNNLPMPMSNNNMPMMTDDQQMQMMQNNPQDMNNMDTTIVEGSGDSMMGADGDSTMMEGMQQQGQVMQTNPQMMTSQQMMQQPPPYQMNTMPHPNVQMMHTQPQQQQHRVLGSQQMMNPNHPTNMMMMNNGQQQQNMGSHQMPMMMNHLNPMLGVRHVPSPSSTPQDVQLTTVNATNNATASNTSTIVQFNPLPGSRLTRSLYATASNNANQQQSHGAPNQTSFNSQVPNNSTNSTSPVFQQGLNTTLLQNGTNSQNSSQVSEDQRPVHPKLQGVAHMFRNIF